MTDLTHHIEDDLIAAYATGALPYAYSVIVAAHVSMCETCRAAVEAHDSVGGLVLDESAKCALSDTLKQSVFDLLDEPDTTPTVARRDGIYPGPVIEALKGRAPQWKKIGGGVKQDILFDGDGGSLRLLHIPAGQAVPDHGHRGIEMTMVLQGSFSDETGRFGVGDVEIADEDLDHTPIADEGEPCICIAAADAPLRFNAIVPRLLQPLLRI